MGLNGVATVKLGQRGSLAAACGLLLLATYAIPQFLRMPLTNDAQMYDLQVRLIAKGGVLYRDVLEPNLPGVVWIQSLVRQIAGPSTEALRGFDLLVFAGVMFFVSRWFRAVGWSAASRIWLMAVCFGFYVSQSEWCHTQRDGWLLLPVLAAISIRQHLVFRQFEQSPTRAALFTSALAEGLLWGIGVWLKPHVLIAAALVWIVANLMARPGFRVVYDFAGLLLGGLIVGGLGVGWMIHHQCWQPFWETVSNWNPQYFAAGKANWTLPRFLGMAWRMSPWIFLHVPAVWISLRSIATAVRDHNLDRLAAMRAILAACYLGWLVQAFLLQHLFDYVHSPPILLAIWVVAGSVVPRFDECPIRATVIGFLALAVIASPLATRKRLERLARMLSSPRPRGPVRETGRTHQP